MNYWLINQKNEGAGTDLTNESPDFVYTGWDESMCPKFYDEVKKGDIIIVTEGAHYNTNIHFIGIAHKLDRENQCWKLQHSSKDKNAEIQKIIRKHAKDFSGGESANPWGPTKSIIKLEENAAAKSIKKSLSTFFQEKQQKLCTPKGGTNMANYFTNEVEIQKRKELAALMDDWKNQIKSKGEIVFPDDGRSYDTLDYFTADGFFPGYFSAKTKVLFIGRESRSVSDGDRITGDLEFFKNYNPNSTPYWRRILYLTYGIKNEGKVKFDDVPYADEILKEMVESKNYGFAVMNISKYANESVDGGTADYSLINRFLTDSELSKRNFIREEIALLNPDVIITMNLWGGGISYDELEKVIPTDDCKETKAIHGVANLSDFDLDGKHIKLLDLFHFSSHGNDQKMFYDPAMKLLFN